MRILKQWKTANKLLTNVEFADASKSKPNEQIAAVVGFLIERLRKGATIPVLSRLSQKSKRLVKSVGNAEQLITAKGIPEVKAFLKPKMAVAISIFNVVL